MKVILVIDDDEIFLKTIEQQLSENNFRVFTASSGKQGLQIASTLNPDLIICDLKMPEMDGLEVLKKLRENEVTREVPAIVLTAVKKKEFVYACMRYNIIDYITKPYDIKQLINKINIAIEYSEIKKNDAILKGGENIVVAVSPDSIIISFKIKLGASAIIKEAHEVFNQLFFKLIADKKCIIDLRSLSEFRTEDARVLATIIQLFGNRELYIVAGRHYGSIMTEMVYGDVMTDMVMDDSDFDDKLHFFISFGDMELFMQNK